MRSLAICSVLFWMTILAASGSRAATLNVVGGELIGASNVDVGGNLYNVEFLDGTCVDLYNGCDDESDFTFNNSADAQAASQALLDQVFLDVAAGPFDTQPWLVRGCTAVLCIVFTPYIAGLLLDTVIAWQATNLLFVDDQTQLVFIRESPNTFFISQSLWASWAPIPEPSTALLMGLGLVGLAVRRGSRRPTC